MLRGTNVKKGHITVFIILFLLLCMSLLSEYLYKIGCDYTRVYCIGIHIMTYVDPMYFRN
jgi:hypothetical protein